MTHNNDQAQAWQEVYDLVVKEMKAPPLPNGRIGGLDRVKLFIRTQSTTIAALQAALAAQVTTAEDLKSRLFWAPDGTVAFAVRCELGEMIKQGRAALSPDPQAPESPEQ